MVDIHYSQYAGEIPTLLGLKSKGQEALMALQVAYGVSVGPDCSITVEGPETKTTVFPGIVRDITRSVVHSSVFEVLRDTDSAAILAGVNGRIVKLPTNLLRQVVGVGYASYLTYMPGLE